MTTSELCLKTRDGRPAADFWRLDDKLIHLNHGSFGGVPVPILDEQAALKAEITANPVRWFCEVPGRIRRARHEVAARLDVDPDNLVFVPNASGGASVLYDHLASSGPVHVAVTDHGYGAVVMGAERLARRTGGSCQAIHIPLAASADEVVRLIDEHLAGRQVQLLVLDQVTSATARAFPVDEVCEAAHARGVLVLVDGAHGPGVLADPVARKADVWVGNLHKFWCAPPGCAVLVRNNTDLDLYPLIDSWGAPEAFAERFDSQGTGDHTAWLLAHRAWDVLDEEFGWQTIREHNTAVMDAGLDVLAAALREVGVDDPFVDVGMPLGPLRLVKLPGGGEWNRERADALRVPFMEGAGFVSAFTSFEGVGFMRLSTHAYTTPEHFRVLAEVGIPALVRLVEGGDAERKKDQ